MKKNSSCIAVFSRYKDAIDARRQLLASSVEKKHISLIGKDCQEGYLITEGLENLDDELHQLGVQEGNLYCYKCLIHSGSYLLIVSGNYEEVEYACKHLEQHEKADVSIHFNTV